MNFPCPTPTATITPPPTNTPTPTNTPAATNTPTITPTPFPCGNTWATLTPYPTAISSQATTALNGLLYSFGGITNTDTNVAYRYDPATNAWTPLASLPAARSGASAVSDGTYIYILGGSARGNHTNTVYRYDPVANSYTTLAAMPLTTVCAGRRLSERQDLPHRRLQPGELLLRDGPGGHLHHRHQYLGERPGLPDGVAYTSAVVRGGFIYVAGGKDGNGQATSKTYRLDPATNTWDDAAIADLPAARQEVGGRPAQRALDPGRRARHLRPACWARWPGTR